MGELLNLSVYNPSLLSDDDFLRSFVARQPIAKRLIERLREVRRTGLATHQLILGQRGMGKTSMLRRIALAVNSEEQLRQVFIPLSFREEQYNVHSLSVFWGNCLDALGDWYDRTGQAERAKELDQEIAKLNPADKDANLETFRRWIASENRRPLLLLDNVDLILNGLRNEQWALRKHFQEPGGVVVVGGSATYMEATADRDAAFYDFFQVTKLDKLSKEELIACLRSLALARGSEGEKVVQVVENDPGRIRTIHDLTGGNPRTLTLLYMLLEVDTSGDVFSDLERLLDQVTVLYKARVEDLSPQARVVLDAVALAWNPVLASAVAVSTGLEVTTVSSQLDRLQKDGIIEKVTVSKTTKTAYQICERFFNIWYLMRHGPRRQRTRLRWLTGFLKSFYSPAQLVERAKLLVNGPDGTSEDTSQMLLALSEAIDDEGWRSLLKNHVRDSLERLAQSIGKRLEEIVDPAELPRPVTPDEWVRHGNLLRQHLKRAREAEAAFASAIALDITAWGAWYNLGGVRLMDLADTAGAVQAYRMAVSIKPDDLSSHFALGNALEESGARAEAEETYKKCLRLRSGFYLAAIALGDLLLEQPGRLAEAEHYYVLAGRVAPKNDTNALHGAAFFAGYIVEQFDRAIRLYRRLVQLAPQDLVARSNLFVLEHFSSTQSALNLLDEGFLAKHPKHGRAMIQTLVGLRTGDAVDVNVVLSEIFDAKDQELFETYRGFLLLMLRELHRRGLGASTLRWFDDSGTTDRQWPLKVAYDAFVNGSEALMDVNPEVRSAAEKIYALLTAPVRYAESSDKLRSGDRLPIAED
jgi:tetratricopeptide (TPR) repeat protein